MTNGVSVLVTGADGFIGSHLTELLVKEGYQVKALSQYNSFNYWGWLEDVECIGEVETMGDATTTSFFPAKPLGCYGDGGAVFTNRISSALLKAKAASDLAD